MKKSNWAIISISCCVGALLIVSGVLFIKSKSTDNSMMPPDGYFYLTYGHKKPLEGSITEGIGEIPSVIITYRHSNGLTYRAPLVTFDISKDEPIRSIIVKKFSPRGLSYSKNIQSIEPVKYESIRSGIVKRYTARWPSGYSKNIQWEGIDLDSQKKFKFFLQRY